MKQILLSLLLLAFSFNTLYAVNDPNDIIKVGDEMPPFSIVMENGTKINAADYKGKVILVTLFATWCPPCLKELPQVQKQIWDVYKDNPDFQLLVVGREHNEADLKKFNEKRGFTFPLYPDKNRSIFSSFAKNAIPRNYLIGKDGKVVYTSKGYTPAEFAELIGMIQTSLQATK
jgi:peroxiredoxin